MTQRCDHTAALGATARTFEPGRAGDTAWHFTVKKVHCVAIMAFTPRQYWSFLRASRFLRPPHALPFRR